MADLKESGETPSEKIQGILESTGDIGMLNLADIIDAEALQSLMEEFYKLTNILGAVLDISGNILVAVGWQDICTKFHRCHPDTNKNCLESDTILSNGLPAGEFKAYRCKNNLWDMVTPIVVGGRHLGNIFIWQFFYDDEVPDYEIFRDQAHQYGFDEKEYLAALDRVPRLSRETVDTAMTFYSKLAGIISSLSLSTLNLSQALSQQEVVLGKLSDSEGKLQQAQKIAGLGDFTWDIASGATTWSAGMYRLLQYDKNEAIDYNKINADIHHPDDLDRVTQWLMDGIASGEESLTPNEYRLIRKDGQVIQVLTNGQVEYRDGQAVKLFGTCLDITERKRSEEALQKSEIMHKTMFNEAPLGIALIDSLTGYIYSVNPMFAKIAGRTMAEMENIDWIRITHPDDIQMDLDNMELLNAGKISGFQMEKRYLHKDGSPVWINMAIAPIHSEDKAHPRHLCMIEDISERKLVAEEQEKLQTQLAQAQKMETVGRLAGGVAHDFNNMLGVIIGHTEMALENLEPGLPIYSELEEIRSAGRRSADLTRQLLAFARQQTISPMVLDLNKTVESMLIMLQRLLGEDIDLVWKPDKALGSVNMDPSQIDQMLANLCVNARDAIADVGKITIETGTTIFDEDYCSQNAGFRVGEFVLLAVSDDGCGMDQETMGQVFEPFYTTKELGKGPAKPDVGGEETILLVEDEEAILSLTRMMLERLGYTVVSAGTPSEAIKLAGEYGDQIHLLLTDVVMPEMNGRDLAKHLLTLFPNLNRLFMSGYTSNVIAHHGVLEKGVNFIQKPFSKKDLAVKLREVLDSSQE